MVVPHLMVAKESLGAEWFLDSWSLCNFLGLGGPRLMVLKQFLEAGWFLASWSLSKFLGHAGPAPHGL